MKIMTKNFKTFCIYLQNFQQNWSRNNIYIIFEKKVDLHAALYG